MEVNISFIYTPDAKPLKPEEVGFGNFAVPDLSFVPLSGDLISFGPEDATVFEVVNRLFMWKSAEKLDVQLLLGAVPVPPEDQADHGK